MFANWWMARFEGPEPGGYSAAAVKGLGAVLKELPVLSGHVQDQHLDPGIE